MAKPTTGILFPNLRKALNVACNPDITFNLTRKKSFKYLVTGLFMTGICAWSIVENFWFGWVGITFFGLGSILFLIKIINPKFKWVNDPNPNSSTFLNKTKTEFASLYSDTGIFTYSDNSFAVKTDKGEKVIKWTQIERLTGFKRDYLTTDCICLLVEYNDNQNFEVTEEHPGWFQFIEHLKETFPTIDKSWEFEIATPAFQTKETILFDRNMRAS